MPIVWKLNELETEDKDRYERWRQGTRTGMRGGDRGQGQEREVETEDKDRK